MVDINKLNNPVEKEKRRKARIEHEKKLAEREKANRYMIAKLHEMLENDKIQDEYDQGFITSIYARINAGLPLSEKQEAYLEKCFHEKY